MTSAEARKRKKAVKQSLTKEERKADKVTRRAEMAERREKMMSGNDAYLLPRDKGPVRKYVRDLVDARRNLLGLFMPAALIAGVRHADPADRADPVLRAVRHARRWWSSWSATGS